MRKEKSVKPVKTLNGHDYYVTSLYFSPQKHKEEVASHFLSLIGRNKTPFISELIYSFLLANNVTDISNLSTEQARNLALQVGVSTFAKSSPSIPLSSIQALLNVFGGSPQNIEALGTSEIELTTTVPQEIICNNHPDNDTERPKPVKKKATADVVKETPIKQEPKIIDDEADDFEENEDFEMDDNVLQGLSTFGFNVNI